MSTPRFSLSDGLTVEPADDGNVSVTVVLPPDLVADYCQFLDALSNFFRVTKRKASLVESLVRATSPERLEEVERSLSDYRSLLVTSFDSYVESGLDRKEAVKRVAADLRAKSHPWCAVHVVRSQLVLAGRGGKPGRPRHPSSSDGAS